MLDWQNISRQASRSIGSQKMSQPQSNELHSQIQLRDVSEKT